MKIITVMLAVLASLSFVSCDGSDSDVSIWDQLSKTEEISIPAPYTIKGEVSCPLCKPYDMMMVNVESTKGEYLISNPFMRTFDSGDFKIKDVLLLPKSKVIVRVSIGSVAPAGKIYEVAVPEDTKEMIVVKAEF